MGKGQHRVQTNTQVHTKKGPEPGLEYWEGFLDELSKEKKSFSKNEPIYRQRAWCWIGPNTQTSTERVNSKYVCEHIRS